MIALLAVIGAFVLAAVLVVAVIVLAERSAERRFAPLLAIIDEERSRSRELMTLVESQRAPAEYAAYVRTPVPDPDEWVFDETGLIGFRDES